MHRLGAGKTSWNAGGAHYYLRYLPAGNQSNGRAPIRLAADEPGRPAKPCRDGLGTKANDELQSDEELAYMIWQSDITPRFILRRSGGHDGPLLSQG